jgi:hypothetical protein
MILFWTISSNRSIEIPTRGIPLVGTLADMGGHNSAPVMASSKITMGLVQPEVVFWREELT